MTKEVVGFNIEGCVIVGHRPTEVILIVACHSTIDIVAGMLRKQFDALSEILLTLLPLLLAETDDGPLCPDATVVGIEFQTLVERLNGTDRILFLQIDFPLHRIGTSILRPPRDHGVYLRHGLFVVLVLNQTKDAVIPEQLVLRVIAQRPVIILYRLREPLLVDTTERPHLIGTHHIGIALDGFRTIVLGTTEVIQIVFCHTTEEPRLIEPGLLTDGLIEILDGEHVVLIVEG